MRCSNFTGSCSPCSGSGKRIALCSKVTLFLLPGVRSIADPCQVECSSSLRATVFHWAGGNWSLTPQVLDFLNPLWRCSSMCDISQPAQREVSARTLLNWFPFAIQREKQALLGHKLTHSQQMSTYTKQLHPWQYVISLLTVIWSDMLQISEMK